jgi:uncharacterized protein (TIGR02246 family)
VKPTERVEFATIGAFYDAIQRKIRELGDGIFVKKTAPPQVVSSEWFPAQELFVITDVKSACRAIDLIKIEGEGTTASPFQQPGDPAHYYKFGEIAAGREIQQTPDGYAYSGEAILFEPSGVWPLKPNCKIADFPVGTQARTRIEQFAYGYSTLLNALHETFNGEPSKLNAAIGMMYDLRVLAAALMQTDTGDEAGLTVGPSFEFVQVQGGMPSTEVPANRPLSLISTWYIAPGNEDRAMKAVNALAEDVKAGEADTLIYLVHTPYAGDTRVSSLPPPHSGTIVFFEMYRTVEAFLRHLNGPIFTSFLANSGNLFVAQNGAPFTVVSFFARQAGFVRTEAGSKRVSGVNRPSFQEEGTPDRAALRGVWEKIPGPNGERFAEAFSRGTLRVLLYAPRTTDPQTPHEQDEVYVVMKGSGAFLVDGVSRPFAEGDVLFVPAGATHRFQEFTDDLTVWAIFYGPNGGEAKGDPRREIGRANAAFSAAFAAGDAAAVAGMYTEAARLLPPNAPIVEGRDAIERFWVGVMASGIKAVDLKTSEVEAFGDTAVECGSATLYAPSGAVADRGKYLVVWKYVEGRWRLHRDCWNSNGHEPGQAGAASG